MFDKRLSDMDMPVRVLFTCFLLLLGAGYIASVFTIYISHREADGRPALTMNDIIITYYGDRESTVLETESLGGMKVYYESDADVDAVILWVKSGADRIGYEKVVAPIMKKSCIECHSPRGIESGSPLTTFDEVKGYTEVDTGVSLVRLAGLSHTHIISHGMMFFLLSIIFLMTGVKDRWKIILFVSAFIAILGDVLFWWLGKLSHIFAYGTVFFGALLGITFLFYFFVPIYEMWFFGRSGGGSSVK